MKLAQALSLRKELVGQSQSSELRVFGSPMEVYTGRVGKADSVEAAVAEANARSVPPSVDLAKHLGMLARLACLEEVINAVNAESRTEEGGNAFTISALLVQRNLLKKTLDAARLRQFAGRLPAAQRTSAGDQFDDVKVQYPAVQQAPLLEVINALSMAIRNIDDRIQRLNWQVDVDLPDWVAAPSPGQELGPVLAGIFAGR